MAKPTIVTRAGKGSALTWTEGDANLTNLSDATISVTDGTNTSVLNLNDTLTLTPGASITLSVNPTTDTITINTSVALSTLATSSTVSSLTSRVTTSESSISILQASPTFTGGITTKGSTNLAKLTLDTTAISSTAWTTNGIGLKIQAATFTDTSSTAGTVAASYVNAIAAPTMASTNAITVTDAATLYIATRPTAGTNTTITNGWALLTAGNIKASDFTGTIGATTASTGAFTTLSASSTVSGTGFSTYLASPPAIGGTAAAAGTFTSLTATGTTTLATSLTGLIKAASGVIGTVVSGTDIKTVNSTSILGSGNIAVGTVTSIGGTGTINGLTLTGTVTSTGNLTLGGTLDLSSPPAIGGTTPSTGAFTTVSASTTGTNGALNLTYNPASTSGSAIQTTGKDSQGGVGYFDFFKATNTTSGVTNGNKTFRLNSTGNIEIINSAYSATILSLTDGGFLTVAGLTVTSASQLKDIRETVYTSGATTGTITPDVANGTVQKITLTGNITFNAFSNPQAGQCLTLIITNSSGGGLTLTSTMKFSGASKTLSTGANAVDILTVVYDGSTYWASLGKGFA